MMKEKKTPKPQKQLSGNSDSLPLPDAETKSVIQAALQSFLREELEKKNISQKNLEALIGVVEEFLNSFIILGYTFEGTPIQYVCAHSQQEADSLATLVNKFFMTTLRGPLND
jgi:hypothetical protein